MKKKPQPKTLVVTDTETITPNMQRITLQGEALSHFPRDCEGSYIKLLFNDMGGADLSILSEDDDQSCAPTQFDAFIQKPAQSKWISSDT